MRHEFNVREYLSPTLDTFWEWRDDGEVVAWKDGTTIAFRDEIRAVLAWLAPHGLPPFDCVALLLAATHDAWTSTRNESRILDELLENASDSTAVLRELLPRLDEVAALDSKLRTPVRSKSVLVEMGLSGCRTVVEPDAAVFVVEAMRCGLGEVVTPPEDYVELGGYGAILFARDMADMLLGLRRLTADALSLRLATGMDEVPAAAEIELPPCEAARALIDSMQDDLEFSGLARVARQLLAVASLPRRLEPEDEYHTGGFSDISNRGSMERLLISELANDDLTLAVRVAMNEALYLRREIPPSTPHYHRALLIDAGIRSWGVPRVFATAVALAFMAGTAKEGSYSCFRAKRNRIESADLTTRAGIVHHLSVLETDLQLSEALPAFNQQIESDDNLAEPILLMTEDALADSSMQLALRKIDLPQLFVATVNRDGVFRLAEYGIRGMKVLREARIEIDELFRLPATIVEKSHDDETPAINSVNPFPLLLPYRVKDDRVRYVDLWGVIGTPGDGRLMRWQHVGRGGQQLSAQVTGRILWTAPAAVDGHLSIVVGASGNTSLLRISDENVVVDCVRLKPHFGGGTFCARNGVLFLVHVDRVEVLDMHSGQNIQSLRLPDGIRPVRDRFLVSHGPATWYALSYDGSSARLEPIECAEPKSGMPPLITMFDQVGIDGPIGVTQQDGCLFSTANGNVQRVHHGLSTPLTVPWISADGRRLHLKSLASSKARHATSRVIVDTKTLTHSAVQSDWFDDRVIGRIPQRQINLRHRFMAIGLNAAGKLALESRRGQVLVFDVQEGLPVFKISAASYQLRARQTFERVDGHDRQFELKRACWPNGSRAFLDSRGLLHLVSADRSIPEVTLVLAEGQELSGWCADGRIWGNRYFVGERATCEESAAAQYAVYESTVVRFAEQLDA